MKNDIAGFFLDGWYMFDNFSSFSIIFQNKYYPTVEHAFQSLKYAHSAPDIAEKIRCMTSPAEVFAYTRRQEIKSLKDPDWDAKKIRVMEDLIRAKFDQHHIVREALERSGSLTIVEMNDNDDFWGWGTGPDHQGGNMLGKTWMKVRREYAEVSKKE